MEMNNEELKKDLEEQYAILEEEVQEDKKRKRYLILFIFFLSMFLIMFGSTFSYFKLYNGEQEVEEKKQLLKDLYIENYEDAFNFDADIHYYALTVSKKTTMVNVKYVLTNQKTKVKVTGNEELKEGINEIIVKVTDEDGNEEEYIIYVTVPEEIEDPIDDPTKPNSNPSTPTNPGTQPSTPTDPGQNPTVPTNPSTDPSTDVPVKRNLDLKKLAITNHPLDPSFNSAITAYIVNDINETEDSININFELKDNTNLVNLKLNNVNVSRNPNKNGTIYSIKFNVKTELNLGANKFEIIVSDSEGNKKTYTVLLVVNKVEEEQKVIEITVDYGNNDGNYSVANIIPGWESPEKQWIKITNTSNYDTRVDIRWTNVENNFVNINDLEYSLYKDNVLLQTGNLPVRDGLLIGNLNIPANSENYYYLSYRFIYKNTDQNVDQGKTFSTKLNVSLSK